MSSGEHRSLNFGFREEHLISQRETVSAPRTGISKDEKFVIFASSTGTVFKWYDFYLYATLAPFFAALFFLPGNDTAALLSAFAT